VLNRVDIVKAFLDRGLLINPSLLDDEPSVASPQPAPAPKIAPIPTVYKGYSFRSRLEARWAVFLDVLGIKWVYEDDGFTLPDGKWYLPDFWLPTFNGGMFLEVKPEGGFGKEELLKCGLLCELTHKDVWLGEGVPELRVYCFFTFGCAGSGCPKDVAYLSAGIPSYDAAEGENRMYVEPGFYGEIPKDMLYGADLLIDAVGAARGAKFEHGRRG